MRSEHRVAARGGPGAALRAFAPLVAEVLGPWVPIALGALAARAVPCYGAATLRRDAAAGALVGLGVLVGVAVGGGVRSLLEEVGWSGFALPRLLARTRPLAAGVAIGALWRLWHLPINVWAQSPRLDANALLTYAAAGRIAFLPLVAYRVLLVWDYVNTGRSLLLAWLAHWFLIAGLSPLAFGGVFDPPLSHPQVPLMYGGITGVLWTVVAVLVALTGSRLTRAVQGSGTVS